MERSTNALAELAKRLELDIRMIEFGNVAQLKRFRKVKRIVEELAKVSDGHWEVICDGPDAYFCTAGDLKVRCAIGRCRVIAEEGVKDGK